MFSKVDLSTIEDRLNEIFKSIEQLNARQGAIIKETLSHLDRISNYHIDLSNELIRRADSISIHTHDQRAATNCCDEFNNGVRGAVQGPKVFVSELRASL